MAVTLTVTQLAAAIRAGDTTEETAELTRLLDTATEMVTQYVETAPDTIHNEAAIRVVGYLYDAPTAGRTGNVLRLSGAAALLLPYRVHRAGLATSEAVAAAQGAIGTAGNLVVGLSVNGNELVVTFADGTTETHTLPDAGLDQTARDAAQAAQATADGKIDRASVENLVETHKQDHNAHHTPPHVGQGGTVVDVVDGRLPGPPVAFRMGWAQSRTVAASVFTRADNHPIDGASVGTTAGLGMPPFPPALNTDRTLYLHLWIEGDPDIAEIFGSYDVDPVPYTSSFPVADKTALTVDSTDGHAYVSSERFASLAPTVFAVISAGAEIATVPGLEAHAADPNAHHVPAMGGGDSFPSYHQALQTSNLTLSTTDTVLPGLTLPAANFNAGEKWRFTAVVNMAGIGTTAHDVRVSLNAGGNAYVNTEIRQDDESSPTRFNAIIDYVLTMPAVPGAVDVRARESLGNILTQSGSSLIAVRMG